MRTQIGKAFDKKIQLYVANSNGTFSFVSDVWSRVQNVNFENYDTVGQSINNYDKKVTCRQKNLDSNLNAFLIDGVLYQINRSESNYKGTQWTYYLSHANVNLPV